MIVDKSSLTEITPKEVEEIKEQEKNLQTKSITTIEEAVKVNAMCEVYLAVRKILEGIHVDPDNLDSPRLFRTIKVDNGQLSRIKYNEYNKEYAIAFPACFLHFVDMYWNVGQYRINEGKGSLRLHYVLNRLNNGDDDVEMDGFRAFSAINNAINEHKEDFPALVNRFQLQYWDQPLTFDDGLQPYWIDYQIWFSDYSSYAYKDYVERFVVVPPFTNHSDQNSESNQDNHENHKEPTIEEAAQFTI